MGKNILVIDDEDAIRKSFQLALEETPFEVAVAASGEKGIEMFQDGAFDLVFLDLKMPGLNGVETLTALRKMDTSVPIYIITAFYEEYFDQLREAEAAGLDFELMKKPIGNEEIVMVASGILGSPAVQ